MTVTTQTRSSEERLDDLEGGLLELHRHVRGLEETLVRMERQRLERDDLEASSRRRRMWVRLSLLALVALAYGLVFRSLTSLG